MLFDNSIRTGVMLAMASFVVPGFLQAQNGAKKTPTPAAAAVVPPTEPTLAITAAVVLGDMTVRPLPAFAFVVVSQRDTSDKFLLRTALDGTVSRALPPGDYVLRSSQPAVLNDSSYQWTVPITLGAAGEKLELTNANATSTPAKKVAG